MRYDQAHRQQVVSHKVLYKKDTKTKASLCDFAFSHVWPMFRLLRKKGHTAQSNPILILNPFVFPVNHYQIQLLFFFQFPLFLIKYDSLRFQ